MTNVYIVAGPGAIEWTPFFAPAGFRYVTVSGLPSSFEPSPDMLQSHFVHTGERAADLSLSACSRHLSLSLMRRRAAHERPAHGAH